ncbi:hypothetical protein [Pseudomonas tohonis]|uniref:hypothetical protein n=1 Tax=Pseudomonas tohonis TaxID=2725477 RepID=UPI0022F0A2F5|nr:hypothetical protein [Pseudomonas tohonis]
MRRKTDTLTLDLFSVPQPILTIPGEGNYSAQVAELVSNVLRSSDLERVEIAARMSHLSGDVVSENILNAWSATSRTSHNVPFHRAVLLEEVCGSHALTNWMVARRGGQVAYGEDALHAELGRLERTRDEAARRARELKAHLSKGGRHA